MNNSDYCVHLYDEAQRKGDYTVKSENYIEIDMNKRYYAYGLIERQYNLFITSYEKDEELKYSVANFSDIVNKWSEIYSADCVAAWIGLCISRCFYDMQKNGINAHRDVKPSNILVEEKNVNDMFSCRFVLADFGIAYLNESNDEKLRKARVGTKGYRPPDEFMAHDWRDDQYMLGKTLCEYYGILKPGSNGYNELEKESLWGQCFATNKYGIRDIIFRMISDNPEDRYQDVVELICAFETALQKINGGIYASFIPAYSNFAGNTADNSSSIFCGLLTKPIKNSINEEQIREPEKKEPTADNAGPQTDNKNTESKYNPIFAQVNHFNYEQICTYIKKGKIDKARALLLEKGSAGNPHLIARFTGLCYYFEGKHDIAKNFFIEAKKTDIVSVYYLFALETNPEKKFSLLQEVFLKMSSTHPLYPAVCYNLYRIYRNTDFVKKYEKTIKARKKRISPKKLLGKNAVVKDIQMFFFDCVRS